MSLARFAHLRAKADGDGSQRKVREMARQQGRTRTDGGGVWGPGIEAGLVGALSMGLLWMIVAAAKGAGFLAPMKLVAATFMGPAAMSAGAAAVVLGLATHLVVGACFGVFFAALLAPGTAPGIRFAGGLIYGVGIFVVMTIVVLPLVNTVMAAHVDVIWFSVYHLVYGYSLSVVIPAARTRHARPGRSLHA